MSALPKTTPLMALSLMAAVTRRVKAAGTNLSHAEQTEIINEKRAHMRRAQAALQDSVDYLERLLKEE